MCQSQPSDFQRFLAKAYISLVPHTFVGPKDKHKLMGGEQKWCPFQVKKGSPRWAFPTLSSATRGPGLKWETHEGERSLVPCDVVWKRATQENCQKRNILIGLCEREKKTFIVLIIWDLRLLVTTVSLSLLIQGRKLDFQEIFWKLLSYRLNDYLGQGKSRVERVLGGLREDIRRI